MAVRYLKESKSQTERNEDDAKVKAIVEDTLADIEARGDAAIRELSEKFDNPKLANEFMSEAKAISKSRNIARAHYPSDSKLGEELGKKMFRYIKNDVERKL